MVTGDVTQIDLPVGQRRGLHEARELLTGIQGIAFCQFSDIDVVRHPLVMQVIKAYEKRDLERAAAKALRSNESGPVRAPGAPPVPATVPDKPEG